MSRTSTPLLPRGHTYTFYARTHSLTTWNCCSEMRRWTRRRATCVISWRARSCCAEARYRQRPRGILDRCSRLIGRLCTATAPGASKRGCGSETPCRAPESTRTLRCTAGCGALRSCSCFGCKTCMPLRRLPLHRLPLHRSTTSLWSGIRCCALRMHVLRPCDCTQSSASI